MPIYVLRCENGHEREIFASIKHPIGAQGCGSCGRLMEIIIQPPLLVKAASDVCYDSPIDGNPVTSWAQRREDLARSGCRPYDPDMKTDHANRIKDSEEALDRTIDATVEETIEKMPTAKRGKLYSELTEQGVSADVVRTTPHA